MYVRNKISKLQYCIAKEICKTIGILGYESVLKQRSNFFKK